jgi:hypothetical protein
MAYRNKTYIAADWDKDKEAVDQLRKWNSSNYWGLDFYDVHEAIQTNSEKPCTIKKSLGERLDNSKHFVLIVGESTNNLTKGKCSISCSDYSACTSSKSEKSYIEFECDGAKRRYCDEGLPQIIVLYKSATIDKSKCPNPVKDIALTHAKMRKYENGKYDWDYSSVKAAFDKLN